MTDVFDFVYTGNGQTVPKDVVSVRFHSSVVEVGEEVFKVCKQLKKVELNVGLKKIGKLAFAYCLSLERITLPSTVTEVEDNAFNNCTSLREVVFNDGLKKIGVGAFFSCGSLQSITIPSTLIEIDRYAFNVCSNLREVRLHENLETIGQGAFTNCRSLERFNFPSLSARLDSIIRAGQTDIKVKIDSISSVERDDSELFVTTTAMGGSRNCGSKWNTVKESLDDVIRLIRYYETKEATALFELALWKSNLDQAEEANNINRDVHRIEVPGPVKDSILQYL